MNLRLLPLSINTASTNPTVTQSGLIHQPINFPFIPIQQSLEFLLRMLNIAELAFDLATVPLSLEASAVQARDAAGVLNQLAVPGGDFLGKGLEGLLVGGERGRPHGEDLVHGFGC